MTLQEILFYVSVAFFVIAGICIVVAAVIFFMKDVPGVRNYLTGKTIREAVERGSSGSGKTRRRASGGAKAVAGDSNSGKAGSAESSGAQSGPIRHASTVTPAHSRHVAIAQERRDSAEPEAAGASGAGSPAADGSQATTILDEGTDATTVLGETPNAADTPDSGASETTILDDGSSETTILDVDPDSAAMLGDTAQAQELEQHDARERQQAAHGFTVVKRIILTEAADIVRAD